MSEPKREELREGRDHLTVTGTFQSDKYPWCPAGFVPLKITDHMAYWILMQYAERRKEVDEEFCRDLKEALFNHGRKHGKGNSLQRMAYA